MAPRTGSAALDPPANLPAVIAHRAAAGMIIPVAAPHSPSVGVAGATRCRIGNTQRHGARPHTTQQAAPCQAIAASSLAPLAGCRSSVEGRRDGAARHRPDPAELTVFEAGAGLRTVWSILWHGRQRFCMERGLSAVRSLLTTRSASFRRSQQRKGVDVIFASTRWRPQPTLHRPSSHCSKPLECAGGWHASGCSQL
jgi:hypothetical protein